ncbi:MAG: TonB family protein [Gemmatimonadetes bacterium]|nr:TonB family protein [Gemmatimonadota bacterium]MDA1104670.1 TonB family protein [Gemmatimonadota bacterium]
MTAEAVPALEIFEETANERLKRTFSSWFWGSMIAATVVHFSTFAFWPELTAEDFSFTSEELEAIELPPEIEIPPPPQQISRPATPVMAAADIDEDITIAPTTFEENPVEDLPPPPEDPGNDLSAAPTFTPFTVAPTIQNRTEVVRAMEREYPPLLRDAGIGGTARVYFFIDENGRVQDYRIDQSSGHQALDAAALAVADVYRFTAALNRDKKVPVWVSFAITFQVR